MASDPTIRFGPFGISPRTLELWCEGARVCLEPLPVRILARLAEDLGSLVGRGELRALGWADKPWVAEQALNTCIYQIRRVLAEHGHQTVVLETLRGRGYRLSLARGHGLVKPRRRTRRAAVLGAAPVALVALLVASLRSAGAGADSVPEEAEPILARARYLAAETHDFEAARAVLDSARVTLPDVAAIHAAWGEMNAILGDRDAAERGARRALALDPRSATGHRTRGLLAMLASEWTVADAALGRARAEDPTDVRTIATMAYLRTIERRFADADRLLREALRLDPLSATIHQDAGLMYLLMGRFDAADRSCREVLRFQPRSAWATDCLFDIGVLTERTEDAARWGRRLMDLYDAAPPTDLSPASVVATTESWRLERWTEAVRGGADSFGLALAYAANRRADEAVRALQAAAAHPTLGLLSIGVDPRLAGLRGHDGFERLLRGLKLTT